MIQDPINKQIFFICLILPFKFLIVWCRLKFTGFFWLYPITFIHCFLFPFAILCWTAFWDDYNISAGYSPFLRCTRVHERPESWWCPPVGSRVSRSFHTWTCLASARTIATSRIPMGSTDCFGIIQRRLYDSLSQRIVDFIQLAYKCRYHNFR